MAVLIAMGASVWIREFAIVAFMPARSWMSPANRCEKNSMGRCMTFHMYVALLTTPILPLIRSE